MGNILPKVTGTELTYAYPSKIERYSADKIKNKIPCLYVNTNGSSIKKEDQFLYINNVKKDIASMNIQELCSYLLSQNISVSCIEYTSLLKLPAILLLDILSTEVHTAKVKTNPIDLNMYLHNSLKGLVAINSNIIPVYCRNTFTDKKVVFSHSQNRMFIKGTVDSNYVFCYKIATTEFIWNIDPTSLVTTAKEFLSKSTEDIL